MTTTDRRALASGIFPRVQSRREVARLPWPVAVPLIGVASVSLWFVLFRLFTLIF
jgi:hypothetical protein